MEPFKSHLKEVGSFPHLDLSHLQYLREYRNSCANYKPRLPQYNKKLELVSPQSVQCYVSNTTCEFPLQEYPIQRIEQKEKKKSVVSPPLYNFVPHVKSQNPQKPPPLIHIYPYKHHICRFNLSNTQLQKQKRAQNEKSSGEIMAQLVLHLPVQIFMFTHTLQLCSSLVYQASDLWCISPKCSYRLQLLPKLSSKIIYY